MPYSVLIKKNGRTYGTLGPYAKRADALADAVSLKRPGHTVSVVPTKRTHRANNPAVAIALQTLAPYLIKVASKMAKDSIKEYLSMSRKEQVAFLRAKNKYNIPVRMALMSDASARMAAKLLDETLRSGAGDVLVDVAVAGAHAKAAHSGMKAMARPRANSRKRRTKRNTKRKNPWIQREGKLGGPGFLSKSEQAQKILLGRSVKEFGYRSTLGSLLALERNRQIKRKHGRKLAGLRGWLVEKYGGPGSFGPRN